MMNKKKKLNNFIKKNILCHHLEETLWNNYKSDPKQPIPVYISFPKVYTQQNEKDIILQALKILNDDDIKTTLIGLNKNQSTLTSNDDYIKTPLISVNKNQSAVTSMMYLWPFTKRQMHDYIDKFATIKSKNENNILTSKQYE
ncbi:hypothetical protein RFI_34134 [Reticulomyxa filosa]|uniref:Uncharacterized protein n=1 Tax=Reticulomyxa filosa TaxID=46433 RepID=X6LPH7_RETFI|nr:hypothetical protein RFI_34134 [Reticulomyxa filosa]|eukprot:ETO03276.1 hypothetical protein RFI_34134 [Reticulomyxa filosa]